MINLIIALVCYLASVTGSICGIGGGVIIKPVLDATGVMPVTTISFLSGCTVLSMSGVSLLSSSKCGKKYGDNWEVDRAFAVVISLGSIVGGLAGKEIFQMIVKNSPNPDYIGGVQAVVLVLLTAGTLVYSLFKNMIKTKRVTIKGIAFIAGFLLGVISSFLGIGGGPFNLIVLFYLYSMSEKQAAVYSLYVIFLSQISSILSALLQRDIPEFSVYMLLLMCACGVLGGLTGSKINRFIKNQTLNKLFIGMITIIIFINIFNITKYI
ncbi:hypothetical protein DFR58_103159 [Anaerobacterium chartisolvens]|uniref:Probable membrane transporter protein n=1 Tax=Anaerobacterium chartisolvens TaxID=1297424 RepID=A0A369BI97_9FIRM|nr:sulfite exporter TauE/SafE family protein [Anaerobacterium chartisolvens]RCX19414.1 hypothetical protein DFR58_103159 [Anaerobacterium chartisolvens]